MVVWTLFIIIEYIYICTRICTCTNVWYYSILNPILKINGKYVPNKYTVSKVHLSVM